MSSPPSRCSSTSERAATTSYHSPGNSSFQSPQPIFNTPFAHTLNNSPSAFPAPTWHQGHPEWTAHEVYQPLLETTRCVEVDQCRLFGGEPGDDVALCYRMLEYFGGLDYIDSPQGESPDD